jgi:hypothetical protein
MMMFAASDVSSLTGWEWGEYISEAFVIVACAGELVAGLGRKCLTRAHRDRLERLSTILLVAALSASLICLVRTNELSGSVIGSLGDKAEEADRKAKTAIADSATALSQAKDALTKAGEAANSLGKAEDEANKAKISASNALTLASGARREADSFEKDIVFAKKQAADAESHLAEALKQTADARRQANAIKQALVELDNQLRTTQAQADEIRDEIAWRHVSPEESDTIRKSIPASLRGIKVEVRHLLSDPEAAKYASEIADALTPVMEVDGTSGVLEPWGTIPQGVGLYVKSADTPGAVDIQRALKAGGIEVPGALLSAANLSSATGIVIFVWPKPAPTSKK